MSRADSSHPHSALEGASEREAASLSQTKTLHFHVSDPTNPSVEGTVVQTDGSFGDRKIHWGSKIKNTTSDILNRIKFYIIIMPKISSLFRIYNS